MGEFTSARVQHALLKGWHAWLAGSFLVAYVTADENTYAMHQFAGYAVLAAIMARLAGGLLAPAGSPLRLPRPDAKATLAWLSTRKGRHPLLAWFAVVLLTVVGIAALSGAVADGAAWMEHPHEAISEASLWVIFSHITFVTWMYAGKKGGRSRRLLARRTAPVESLEGKRPMIRRLMLAAVVAALPLVAIAADARRDAILADYAAKARAATPGFTAFSAPRGETLFRTKWTGGDARTASCTACHTADPRQPGQNAKTGRPIEPVAVSVNPKRFTDPATVEKQFTRDCKNVLGRECTALEKGDYVTFMAGQ